MIEPHGPKLQSDPPRMLLLTEPQCFPKLSPVAGFRPAESATTPAWPTRQTPESNPPGAVAKRLRQRIANPPSWVRLPPAPLSQLLASSSAGSLESLSNGGLALSP